MGIFRADIIMGGASLPPVPDWKSYQVGSHTPELEKVQRMLKSMGLKVGVLPLIPGVNHNT